MRILVTGANGFIGSEIVAALLKNNYQVICAVRDVASIQLIFPHCAVIRCNFKTDHDPAIWEKRLINVDAVINCAGILSESAQESWQVHYETPKALFTACEKMKIQKVIQISALGVDQVKVPFAESKKAADDFLMQLNLSWLIFRPSLIYGKGSYGGTSLFRGLAALPFRIPLIGNGEQVFQPLHSHDLANAVVKMLQADAPDKIILNAVGPEKITFKELLVRWRHWLKIKTAKFFSVPESLLGVIFFMMKYLRIGPINQTTLKMLQANCETNPQPFINAIGFTPRTMDNALIIEPSHVQERWHAKLYFLRPLLHFSLAITWIFSGILPLLVGKQINFALLEQIGILTHLAPFVFYILIALDIGLGLALFFSKKIKTVLKLQLIVILGYTLVITIAMPAVWLQPFGALLKNIPMLIATLVMLAIEDDR